MRYEIVLAPEAVADLRSLRASDQSSVRKALEQYLRFQPERVSRSRIKRLRGLRRPQFRLRVRDVRVFYDVREGAVEVLAVVEKADAAAWLDREGEKE